MQFPHRFALLCLIAGVCLGDDFAERLFKAGQKAEKSGDKVHAFLLYSKAAALQPLNAEYAMRKNALRADAAMSTTMHLEARPPMEEPSLASEPVSAEEVVEAIKALPPPRLKSQDGLKSFDFTGDSKSVVEKVMAEYGLAVVFDSGYQPPPPFRFHVADVRFEEALRALEAQSDSFLVPVNETIAILVRDTPQKRTEMSPAMAIAIPIPQRISVQDAQEMMTAVTSTLEIRKFTLDPVKRVVYLRDQVAKINAARAMFANLSRSRPQIEVEVEFLEVTKSSSLGYGLQLPTSSSLINFSSFLGNVPGTTSSALSSFLTFGGGASTFGIGIAASSILATFTKSDTSVILKSQVVALDGQATTFHVGQKYPIATATYSGGGSSGINGSQATGLSAPPTINFEDLGLVLKITPSVHDGGEVTLEVSSEFKVLGASDGNGNPTISSRKYDGKVRLKEDESAVVSGLLDTTDGDTISGIFGISSIPVIGRLLRSNTVNHSRDEVLLVLRPHLVDLPAWDYGSPTIWVGAENRPLSYF